MSRAVLTLPAVLRAHAAGRGDAPALLFEGRAVSYRELDQRASRVANGLLRAAVPRQARIAVLDHNSPLHIEIYGGASKAACTTLPVNARLASPELLWILNDSCAPVLFVGREHYELIGQIERDLESVRLIVALHGGHPRWPQYESWRDAQDPEDPDCALAPDDDIVQMYTSGTTGHPKGVCHSYRTWSAFARAAQGVGWGVFRPDDAALVCMPMFHVSGLNYASLALIGGSRVVILRRPDVPDILGALLEHGITDTLLVPALILALTSHPAAAGADFSRLRRLLYGAAPIAPDLLDRARRLLGCEFWHLYGLTENLGGATVLEPSMHREDLGKLRSVGRAYPELSLRVVDQAGRDLPTGTVGEVLLRSAWTMRGYWRNPEASEEALRGGWLHTGDAGYLDADGYLYLHDRVKDMIVSGGENVYPAEVEHALFGHPSVADVAVIGVPDARWGEAVKALIVLAPGATLDVDALLAFARTRIAGYKLPKSIDVIAALPRNPSGKVLRRVLREPYWVNQPRRIS